MKLLSRGKSKLENQTGQGLGPQKDAVSTDLASDRIAQQQQTTLLNEKQPDKFRDWSASSLDLNFLHVLKLQIPLRFFPILKRTIL